MRPRRAALGALMIVAAFGAVAIAGPTPASARQVDADCEVHVAGKRFVDGSHITLHSNRAAVVAVTAAEERPRYKVEFEVAGLRSTVGTGRGRDFGWHRSLDIRGSSKFGVGTYRLRVTTTVARQPCTAVGLVDITGRAPVTTVAGGGAALLALIGIVALAVSLARRGGRPLRTQHAFVVDDPLGQFIAVDTPGNYVGWAEVACDTGARTFVTVKPSGDDVTAFLAEAGTRERLKELRAKGVRVAADNADKDVPRLRWRPRLYVVSPLLGAVGGAGVVGYLQQAAAVYLTPIVLGIGIGAGLVAGLIVANLSRLIGSIGLNRRLKNAEKGLAEEERVEPRYPPIDHLDELDTFVWTATHAIPEDSEGQPAWAEPDRSTDAVATLDPGLPVRVVERRDGLAQVVCSNGWVGWTDADPLQEIDT
jgi:hypothetical protein